jgi:RNA polymerase sigma-70 factor (ECF subfamily)
MTELPDRTAAIRRRDPETLDAVVRETLPGLLRAARAAGLSADRAEDAVQEAMLVFVRRAPEFDGRARVSTWIHGILLHKILEGRRSAQRDDASDDIDEVVESQFNHQGRWSRPPAGAADALAASEVRRLLADCLAGLPDRQRLAFTLRDVEGFESEEICNILTVSANNLGVLLFRARNRLRHCLESKGMRGSADARL